MEEVENNSEEVEIVPPQAEDHVEPQEQEDEPIAARVQSRPREQFRALERKKQEVERELKQERERTERLLEMMAQGMSSKKQEEEPEEPDNDYITKGKVKRVARREVEPLEKKVQELERQLETQKKQQVYSSFIAKHPDFNEIVTPETLAILEEQEPELAQTIEDLKDPVKIAMQSYKFIKAMGLSSKVPESRRAREVERKLESNAKTIQSPTTYEKRPLAQAFVLTDSEKTKLYAEMTGYASQAGGY